MKFEANSCERSTAVEAQEEAATTLMRGFAVRTTGDFSRHFSGEARLKPLS
jgi:hypothetical protein